MINWTLFQCQTPHIDLIGLWWSFEAGNVFENKLSVSARNGEQSFWIWSPHNRERLGQNPPTPVSMQNGGTRSASTGRESPFYADKTHGRWGSYLVSYGIVGPFWFPPVVWVFVHPVGRTKSDKSLIPMWAAPAAEWCFEYINGISTRSTIIKKHFPWIQNWRWYNDCVLGDNSSCLLWVNATILAYIFDNSRCRNPLVEYEDALTHPFDHSQRQEETHSFCSLLMAADKVNRIFSLTQVSAG